MSLALVGMHEESPIPFRRAPATCRWERLELSCCISLQRLTDPAKGVGCSHHARQLRTRTTHRHHRHPTQRNTSDRLHNSGATSPTSLTTQRSTSAALCLAVRRSCHASAQWCATKACRQLSQRWLPCRSTSGCGYGEARYDCHRPTTMIPGHTPSARPVIVQMPRCRAGRER